MPLTRTTARLQNKPVIIIGGGLSGLACAVSLAEQGIKVQLFESARQLGGRARGVQFNNFLNHHKFASQSLDNGQHIMLGAYHCTLKLFKTLGLNEADILKRQALELNIVSSKKTSFQLKVPLLPAPFHLLFALIKMPGFTLSERFSAIKMALKLALKRYSLKTDISVSELLREHQQSTQLIQTLWEPLCLATLNTPIHYASAQVFLNVIKDSFSHSRKDSDLMFFKKSLSQIFCEPALQFICQSGSKINCSSKVISLMINHSIKTEAESLKPEYDFTINTADASYRSDTVVLATPPHISHQLLHSKYNCTLMKRLSLLQAPNATLEFNYEAICTIYLEYPSSVRLPSTMMGFTGTLGQWAIDRALCQQAGVIAVVISGPGKQLKMTNDQLVNIIHKELCTCIAGLPQWLDFRVTKIARATFSCRVGIEQQRPVNQTLIPGLFLAGDYTDTHYPATIEGAIKSGITAASQIIKNFQS